MSKFKHIDIETWDRKEQYLFFREYDSPFFGLTANLDVTRLLAYTKSQKVSFFAAYLFASQKQINAIPEFRYRLTTEGVIEFERVLAGSTVLKDNDLFTFCYFDHMDSFQDYHSHVKQRIAVCSRAETPLLDHDDDIAQIHYSVIPWVHFTSVTHPRNHKIIDSIPKIIFGKYAKDGTRMLTPVSVEAHHALLDGLHMGLYFKRFQECINDPETLLEG